MNDDKMVALIKFSIFLACFLMFIAFAVGLWGCPQYRVWQQGLEGQAELKRAEWNRQVAVTEAQAKHEAAKALAQAEVERAKGVAQANQIIGESLKNNESYLRWLWIEGLKDAGSHEKVIYIPTEAGLPLLEAGRALQEQPKR